MNDTKNWEYELSDLIFDSKYDIILPNVNSKEEVVIYGPEIERLLFQKLQPFISNLLTQERIATVKECLEKVKLLKIDEPVVCACSGNISCAWHAAHSGFNKALSKVESSLNNLIGE